MLKALELHGFKSFAEKTRFEFPDGITVVVGPNGSGKSNIVDAMKWVLGEKSAKSLRGKEMSDVIFKGSGANGGKKPANTAEATIVFDNSEKLLAIDTPEVRVTRRVYRSGEGEYQINGNPCRMRDVRDLFRGTGVGTDAYSLIEQGKVDTLLQASPRERRAIFEEAAGISRFKAKKVETHRRLERVEQNLTRLADIVEEVETRLRSIRNQASKARRYQDYTKRLKELRTQVGLVDWRRFTDRLSEIEDELSDISERHTASTDALAEAEEELVAFDRDSQQNVEDLRECENKISGLRQRIASSDSTAKSQRKRMGEHEHEINRFRRQLVNMAGRVGDVGEQLEKVKSDLESARSQYDRVCVESNAFETEIQSLNEKLKVSREKTESFRSELASLVQRSSELKNRKSAYETEIANCDEIIQRAKEDLKGLTEKRQSTHEELEEYSASEKAIEREAESAKSALASQETKLVDLKENQSLLQQQFIALQQRLAVNQERAKVLEALEDRNEGLAIGVRELLEQARAAVVGPLSEVRGMVADLIRVDVSYASQIDAVLGDTAQYIVADGSKLAEAVASGELEPAGRIGVISLNEMKSIDDEIWDNFEAEPGVLGRVDRFVEVEERYEPLVRFLFRSTWSVDSLQTAIRLSRKSRGVSQFVTRNEDIVHANGAIVTGPRQTGGGIVSRRSELRSLRLKIVDLDEQCSTMEKQLGELDAETNDCEQQVALLSKQRNQSAHKLTECQLHKRSLNERYQSLCDRIETVSGSLEAAESKRLQATESRESDSGEETEIDANTIRIRDSLAVEQNVIKELDLKLTTQNESATQRRVDLAKCEQRVDDLQGQLVRFQEDQRERNRVIDEAQRQLNDATERFIAAQRSVLRESGVLAELYLNLQFESRIARRLTKQNDGIRSQRQQITKLVSEKRKSANDLEKAKHRIELEANQLTLERDSLAQRVKDDYELDLSQAEQEAVEPEEEAVELDREEIDKEIADLRRKLSNIGAVNMAALEEIEQLEERHGMLASQYQDLVDARDALVRIINRINTDSRRLFTETLETIRTNFQRMFRRVFGGGSADIVLEENVDILEAGIDIVATPPGKQSLNLSLLSGGERALTAVTLLMAIFEYRPSPFCVLDEVDGPLDEANIGRFTDVLREFLKWTKFVVVTHSKKTMTAATTLYGVTMQESGVSKRVSVQFEDVTDDGHIKASSSQHDDIDPSSDDDERGVA